MMFQKLILYIDGNHSHPYIDDDIKNYYPKVKEGGIISGHDYCYAFYDVMEAVLDFAKKINQPPIIGYASDWVFFKNTKKKSKVDLE